RGALRGRLERARECLRTRLVRRGVALPAALLGPVLVSTQAAAAVPAALAIGTVKAAARLLGGQALVRVVPANVVPLTRGTLSATSVSSSAGLARADPPPRVPVPDWQVALPALPGQSGRSVAFLVILAHLRPVLPLLGAPQFL